MFAVKGTVEACMIRGWLKMIQSIFSQPLFSTLGYRNEDDILIFF